MSSNRGGEAITPTSSVIALAACRSDNDQYAHINNSVYYHLFDSVVNTYLIKHCGLAPPDSPLIGLVVSSYCNFFSPLSFPAVLDLGLRVTKLGTSSVTYEVGVFEEGSDSVSAVALRSKNTANTVPYFWYQFCQLSFRPSSTRRTRAVSIGRPTSSRPGSPVKRPTSGSINVTESLQKQASTGLIRKGGIESRLEVVTRDYVPPPKTEKRRSKSQPARDTRDRFITTRDTTDDVTVSLEALSINPQGSPGHTARLAAATGVPINRRVLSYYEPPPTSSSDTLLAQQRELVRPLYARPGALPTSTSASTSKARKIPTQPERVLDAPGIVDDFYLNLISWSSLNILAVALEGSTYVWKADSGEVVHLGDAPEGLYVSSVDFSNDGQFLGIGLGNGTVELWDAETQQKLRTMPGHSAQVACLSWNSHILSSGCGDGSIWHHDVRVPRHKVGELIGHQGEVCGLKWREDGELLASGGNDNVVNIWDGRIGDVSSSSRGAARWTKRNHTAAVKALAWCAWQPSLLATGGGTNDATVHVWNTTTGARLHSLTTPSQITSLQWSPHRKEFLTTHGYPTNAVMVHAYPSLERVCEIRDAHDSRVLWSALSPAGDVVCTGAGDENLKFWRVWEVPKEKRKSKGSEGKEHSRTYSGILAIRMEFKLTPQQTAVYLRTLPAIRERCSRVYELAKEGKLQYFDYHPEKEDAAASFCVSLMERDFGSNFASIPPHGRWRHLDAGRPRVEPLVAKWKASANPPDTKEICRRLIDLFLVSVLLDAGAAEGLARVTAERTASAMQVSASNPMVGIEGRSSLLKNLSIALKESPRFFGAGARPGNLVDFLESESIADGDTRRVPVASLWACLIEGLSPIWPPTRSTLGGVALGDVWPCEALRPTAVNEGDELVPFHKLTGWITYSLLEPLQKVMGWKFEGLEDLTGLPEYRNGGLLVDFGVLTLKPGALPTSLYPDPESNIPRLLPSHPAIVEWRAMTVIELDRIADGIRTKLGLSREQLSLAQVLESATWKGGREIAKQKRPATGGPPIEIESDGTVF
ncbi:hypothetical protein NM688_g216 [Phlebia brevispora]|uniref:Uncharacterized protein n=1 Tax=Phlebia brevispora TaxID=194682 RepID=A0ACC1TF87_9APHY|nr:hypothetical protein NM688_g216 [Phlebia brevispora]